MKSTKLPEVLIHQTLLYTSKYKHIYAQPSYNKSTERNALADTPKAAEFSLNPGKCEKLLQSPLSYMHDVECKS